MVAAKPRDADTRRVVVDTNVFISALRSKRGASNLLLHLAALRRFEICLSVSLVMEYESVAKRPGSGVDCTHTEIDEIVDGLCSIGRKQLVYFRLRPFLVDPNDDMIVELAVAGGCDSIITYNQTHFLGLGQFAIRVLTPREFLREIGELP